MSWTDKKSNTSHALGTDDYIVLLGNLRYTKDWKKYIKNLRRVIRLGTTYKWQFAKPIVWTNANLLKIHDIKSDHRTWLLAKDTKFHGIKSDHRIWLLAKIQNIYKHDHQTCCFH